MAVVRVSTKLPASPQAVFDRLLEVRTLQHIAAPWLTFRPAEGSLPEHWKPGQLYRFRLFLFGVLPLGAHEIELVNVDPALGILDSREHGTITHAWNHRVTVTEHPEGSAYEDQVEIDAGLLTPLVWLFAQGFYRHRQRRWRKLLANSST